MTDRKKMGTTMNASTQIQDGTVDEPLLSKELQEKINLMEKRISDLESQLGDLGNVDFLSVYNKAKKPK